MSVAVKNQLVDSSSTESDLNFGVPYNLGPVKIKTDSGQKEREISNNWYKD